MKNTYYKKTAMEEWIEELYRRIGIYYPQELDIHLIAERLNIDIRYDKFPPFSHAGKKVVFLNKRDKETAARIAFFHELCHILRHVGDQRKMTVLFREGQENEAYQFALYAAVPFFMVKKLNIPERHDLAVNYLAQKFNIPVEDAEKRLSQIERRIKQGELDELIIKRRYIENEPNDDAPISEVKLYKYYDYTDDVSGPSQLVIEVSEDIINRQLELFFEPEGDFDRLDDEDALRYNFTPLSAQDIVYKNGRIGLNFADLKLKYGRLSKRLVLQMNQIEQLVNF